MQIYDWSDWSNQRKLIKPLFFQVLTRMIYECPYYLERKLWSVFYQNVPEKIQDAYYSFFIQGFKYQWRFKLCMWKLSVQKIPQPKSDKLDFVYGILNGGLTWWILYTLSVPLPYAPLSVRWTLIRDIFGRDENSYKPKRLCRRVPLSVRCTLIRTIFGRAEVYG